MSDSRAGLALAPLLNGPAPLYHQVREAIRERIRSGEWRPGDRIPTIRELCQQYGVSRVTVIQALDVLTHEGLLGRRQGKGIFVLPAKIEHGPVRLFSFTEEMVRRGCVPGSRVLNLSRLPAPADVADRLGLLPGEPVVLLERLRLVDEQPVGLMRSYLPERYVPGFADCSETIDSLYCFLTERYGIVPTIATDTYEPIRLEAGTATLLQARAGDPAFSVHRVTRDQRNRVVEFTSSILRGDRYKVILELRRS